MIIYDTILIITYMDNQEHDFGSSFINALPWVIIVGAMLVYGFWRVLGAIVGTMILLFITFGILACVAMLLEKKS
jgi:hypothetical protein